MAFKLRRATLRNWQTVRGTATIEFPDKGLVVVLGQNNAAHGRMKSVGSGKSALGEAISRTLLGVRGRFSNFGNFSNDKAGSKDMLVSVELENGDRRLVVDAGYRCKEMSRTGEALRYTLDGIPFERGLIKDTRAELSQLLGVPELLARHTVHVDGDKLKFSDLPQSAIVELVTSVLGQSPWDGHLNRTRKLAASYHETDMRLSASIASMETSLDNLRQEIENAKTSIETEQADYERRLERQRQDVERGTAAVAGIKQKIEANDAKKKEIKVKIKKMEDAAAQDLHDLEIKMRDLQDEEEKTNTAYMATMRNVTACTKDKTRVRNEISDVKSSAVCPTCRRPYEDKIEEVRNAEERLKKRLTELDEEFQELQRKESDARAKHQEADRKLEEARERLKTLAKRNDVSKLSEDYEELETEGNDLSADLNEARQELARKSAPIDQSRLTRLTAILEERQKHEQGILGRIQADKDAAAHNRNILRVLDYWEAAFSPTGIPNLVLNDGLAIINQACERLSRILTGGTLELKFSTTRELKSGNEKPELSISVSNAIGSSRVDGSSKGEGGLTNLILSESLAEVSRVWENVGYRWLDEVVNSQDAVIRNTIYSYLREQAHARGILIFIVDHAKDVRDHADHTLVATKDINGNTTYAWA
jgi:DNA repair exonuclease SbcCD ATPase subunit